MPEEGGVGPVVDRFLFGGGRQGVGKLHRQGLRPGFPPVKDGEAAFNSTAIWTRVAPPAPRGAL